MNIKINKIALSNYRNHLNFEYSPQAKNIAIIGKNGVGKTNILEAISLLYSGKGLRNAKLQEIKNIKNPSENFVIYAEIFGLEGEAQIGTSLDYTQSGKEKRRVRINQQEVRSPKELSEHFNYTALTPMQDQVFSQGLTSRRDYLDNLCELFFSDYSDLLIVYNLAKSERRKLLITNNFDDYWLTSLEQKMAEKAIAITYARLELCERLNNSMKNAYDSGFPIANLSLIGEVENYISQNKKAILVENYFKEKLRENRHLDANSKKTNFGIHKTDFRAIHSVKNMPAELCSQGEQKAILLSITIASVIAKKSQTGFFPVLLLDEVIAHLDEEKRGKLFNFIKEVDCQTWLTGTEKTNFTGLNNIEFIEL